MKTHRWILVLSLLLAPLILASQEAPPPSKSGVPPRPPNSGEVMPPPDSSFFLVQAMRAMDEKASLLAEQGKTAEAIKALEEVYTLDIPKWSPFYEMKVHLIGRLAGIYAKAGKKDQALGIIKKLLSDVPAGSPAEAAAWLEAGTVYKQAGMTEEALKAFDRTIELSKKLAQSGWTPPEGQPGGPRSGPQGRPPGAGFHP